MNDPLHNDVVARARDAHKAHWRMSGDEGTGDKLASLVTATWQTEVSKLANGRFSVEHPIAGPLREKIDIVDLVDGIAYELKASPNNVHMEFYRDIFKVIIARDNGVPQIKRFVFLVPQKGAEKITRGMGQMVIADGHRLGLEIEVVGL